MEQIIQLNRQAYQHFCPRYLRGLSYFCVASTLPSVSALEDSRRLKSKHNHYDIHGELESP